MSEEKKVYDTDDRWMSYNVRLTKDAEVFPSKDPEKPPMVRLTFVSESRQAADSAMWIEANPTDRQADLCGFLRKGDNFPIDGKLCLRRYGDNNEKFALNLRRAECHINYDLLMKLKERGFVPGARKTTDGRRPSASAGNRVTRKMPEKPVQDVDFGDE
jgi:hypothetical protein